MTSNAAVEDAYQNAFAPAAAFIPPVEGSEEETKGGGDEETTKCGEGDSGSDTECFDHGTINLTGAEFNPPKDKPSPKATPKPRASSPASSSSSTSSITKTVAKTVARVIPRITAASIVGEMRPGLFTQPYTLARYIYENSKRAITHFHRDDTTIHQMKEKTFQHDHNLRAFLPKIEHQMEKIQKPKP